jgi:hypothetical protein
MSAILGLSGVLFIFILFWPRFFGNARIWFYGRVTDASGQGISGAVVRFQILYSDRINIPFFPYGNERARVTEITTDSTGNFVLGGVVGYSISIIGFGGTAKGMDLAVPPHDPHRPAGTFLYVGTTGPDQNPDAQENRIVYALK